MDLLGQTAANHLQATVTAVMVTAPEQSDEPTRQQRRETLDALAGEWLDRKAAIEKETAGLAEVAELIGRYLKPGERHELTGVPGVGVQMKRPSRSFDQDAALALLTEEEAKECEVTDLSWANVKKLLKDRGRLEECMKPGSGRGSLVQL